ncbi:hypothetical protein FA95DRAFT_1557141 [Auriscalpium vulgare]|uniref:Uncharacterized protein n=1 Tax=Auriscalpium vulgare TaxID=40419 RepID=A0ACB8RYU5_9AGAM|nr:hypothetical protein FA95DRAFT_1557141 [Auriscalpium vulgare]
MRDQNVHAGWMVCAKAGWALAYVDVPGQGRACGSVRSRWTRRAGPTPTQARRTSGPRKKMRPRTAQ